MRLILGCLLITLSIKTCFAAEINVPISLVTAKGIGTNIGTIKATDTKYGLLLIPSLSNLPPGVHGLHVHENPDCNCKEENGEMKAGLAAGGHFDPGHTGKHLGPYAEGHLGDLPPLFVTSEGKAETPVLAPRLKVADLKNHSLMIHAGGDNFSDEPVKLGGGGARIACGVIL